MLSRYEFHSKEELDHWERLNTAKIERLTFWINAINHAEPFIAVAIVVLMLVCFA